MFDLEAYHYWIIASIILFILEISTPGFLLASFGIGTLCGSLAAYLDFEFKYQLLFFSIATAIAFFGIRPFYNKHLLKYDDNKKIGLNAYIGKVVKVIEVIYPNEVGRIQVGGETWRATAENSKEVFEIGQKVKIEKIDGTLIYISKFIEGEK